MSKDIRKDDSGCLSKARFAAYNGLLELCKKKIYARDILNDILKDHILSSADRAFASKLFLGVAQTLITLDEVIYSCVKSPDDIKEKVLCALRLSTYEIIYLEKEVHAAVDQGVRLVGQIESKAKGLANFVLRRVCEKKSNFPFGDPDTSMEAFARVYAVPIWQCNLICDSLGEKYGRSLIASCNGQPPSYIFVNSIKSSTDEMLELLQKNNADAKQIVSLCKVALSSCIFVGKPAALLSFELKKAYEDGKFIISDIASQAIVETSFMRAKQAKGMLEIGSGIGNKTLMFQSLANLKLGKQLDYFALDNSRAKLNILEKRCKKYGVNVTSAIVTDACNKNKFAKDIKDEFNGFDPSFDHVFVDAPCSGLGTLRRHPELKWRLKAGDIDSMSLQGLNILTNVSILVASKGTLTYSTCTVTNAENEQVCQKFLSSKNGSLFKPLKFKIDGKNYDYFRTQTLTGLNDVHFCASFYK